MGAVSHGADVARLREISGGLTGLAESTRGVADQGGALLVVLAEAWAGPDLEVFAASWESSQRDLEHSADRLQAFARRLADQAMQQDDASQAGAGGAAGVSSAAQGSSSAASEGASDAPADASEDSNDWRENQWSEDMRRVYGDDYFERESDPGAGNVRLPRGADPDSPAIKALLATADGRAALDWMARNGIEMIVDPNEKGAYYSPSSNSMTLGDGKENPETIIHEVNHAKYDAEDRAGDVDDLSRDEYIAAKNAEEAAGDVAKYEFAKQLRLEDPSYPVSPGERDYDAAYAKAYAEALDSGVSPAEADAAGKDAGYQEIYDKFASGEYKGSNTGKTYPEKNGEYWDEQNDGNPFNGW